jgi:hypothetical protein
MSWDLDKMETLMDSLKRLNKEIRTCKKMRRAIFFIEPNEELMLTSYFDKEGFKWEKISVGQKHEGCISIEAKDDIDVFCKLDWAEDTETNSFLYNIYRNNKYLIVDI